MIGHGDPIPPGTAKPIDSMMISTQPVDVAPPLSEHGSYSEHVGGKLKK